jgi:hypothetical protein
VELRVPGSYRSSFALSSTDMIQMWSMYENEVLFATRNAEGNLSNGLHVSQMVAYLGPPPRALLDRGGRCKLFFDDDC